MVELGYVLLLAWSNQREMLNLSSQIQLVGNIHAPDEVQIARESLASLGPDDAGYLALLAWETPMKPLRG